MSILTQKKCTKCGEVKPLESFYRQKGCKDGRRPDCKECSNKRINRCHAEVPLLKRIWSKISRERNKDRERATKKIYEERNRERLTAYRHERYEIKKEYHKAKNHEWYLENKDKVMENLRKRKAIMRGGGGVFTESNWIEVLSRYGNACLRCGSKENIVRDHVVPISRGGRNDKYNIQPLCEHCNLVKFTKTWDFRFDKGVW